MGEDNLWDAVEIPIENKEWLMYLNKRGLIPTVAAPASEVFSVRICKNYFGQRETCEVYGDIYIEDEDGTSHELFCRDPDDAQTLTPEHNTLSLDMPPECAASSTWVRMTMTLKDKSDDAVIVQDVLGFDKVTEKDYYDRVKVRQVGGDSALVTYAAFSTAVLAVVDMTLIKNDISDGLPATADLCGTIVARYGNTYGKKYPGIMLFNNPSNQSIRAVSGIPIELSRDVVVVPAYSFLRIDVQLSQPHATQQDFNGRAEFLSGYGNMCDKLDIQAKDFLIRVDVQWRHPYELKNQVEKPFERPKISTDLHVGSVSREPSLPTHRAKGYSLLEIFTVMIHHNSNSVLKVCGTMGIQDSSVYRLVFDRNGLNPVTLSANGETIPIEGPSWCFYVPESLAMGLKLRDDQGRVLVHGHINWSLRTIVSPISWYDRRICSVIQGVHGYAAVFYTIFSKAVQADVKVSFMCNPYPDVSHRVRGTVVARHSNEAYSTEYEKAYYQSVLFKEIREKFSELKSGCTVPLLKSVVAVPTDAFLTIGVDLYASFLLDELPEEHLKEDVEFNIVPDGRFSQLIESKSYCIEVSVEWTDLYKLYLEKGMIGKYDLNNYPLEFPYS